MDKVYEFLLQKLFVRMVKDKEIEVVNKFDIRAIIEVMERAQQFYGSFTFGEERYQKRRA